MRNQRGYGMLPSRASLPKRWQRAAWLVVGLLLALLVACGQSGAAGEQSGAPTADLEATAAPASAYDSDSTTAQTATPEPQARPADQKAGEDAGTDTLATPAGEAPAAPAAATPVSTSPQGTQVTEVDLNQEFALVVGGKAAVRGTNLQLLVLDLTDYGPDCQGGPAGCPWRLSLLVTQAGTEQEVLISKRPPPGIEASQEVFGFVISFLGVEDGRAILKVTRT